MARKTNTQTGTPATTSQSASAQNQGVGSSAHSTLADLVVAAPPSQGAPRVPAGYSPPSKAMMKGLHKPLPDQVVHVRAVANEVQVLVRLRDWQPALGDAVPSAKQLDDLLMEAAGWEDEATGAKAWADYAQVQRRLAWDRTISGMTRFSPVLTVLASGDSAAAAATPVTRAFVGARRAAGKRAATTRTAPNRAVQRAAKAQKAATRAHHMAQTAQAVGAMRQAQTQGPVVNPQGPAVNPQGPAPTPAEVLQGPAVNPQGPSTGNRGA